MTYRRLTVAQARALAALRMLGEVVVSPQDARPLRALQRRGLVRYERREYGRVAVLRATTAQKRAASRCERQFQEWAKGTSYAV